MPKIRKYHSGVKWGEVGHSFGTIFWVGSLLADVPGATISPPWDFPPKVVDAFLQVPWETGSLEQRRDQVAL